MTQKSEAPQEAVLDPDKAPDTAQGLPQELIGRFVAGEREAFEQVFERVRGDLFLVIRRFFRGAFDQEEAFQEAWLRIYRMRHRFDVNRAPEFRAWLRQVTRHRCLDLLKERGRGQEIPRELMELPCAASQQQLLEQSRRQQALAAFVGQLDQEEQRFFELCFVQELGHEQIALRLQITLRRSKYLKKKVLARMLKSNALRGARES